MTKFGNRLDGPGGRRATPREPVLLNAALLTLSASGTVTLLDVSKTGARMRAKEQLFLRQQVWLKINPADIFGTIIWIDGDECGILFDAPLTDHEVASLQARGRVIFCAGLSPEEQLGAEDWQSGNALRPAFFSAPLPIPRFREPHPSQGRYTPRPHGRAAGLF